MTLRHWQMEKVSGSAEPLLSTTGNKGLNSSGGSTIVYDSTALFGKSSVRSKHFFDTDAAGSLSDNEFTIGFWFYVPTGTEERFIFQLGLHNTNVSTNGHTCVGLYYTYYSNKIFFTTGYKTDNGGRVELGGLSRNVWHHCYISRTNSGTNSTLQVKITATDGTVVHDESEIYTKADFSIDESGTGQYSYFNGHPAGGSLTLTNGRIEDFILKNGSVLSYASIYDSSAEVFQSGEPQVSVSTGAGSATLSDSNFTGTKTYSFYDTDAETLLQSGTSNSYTSYASSSVAYTALVTDTDNNRVISTFFVSQGGNEMAFSIVKGASVLPKQLHGQMLGGYMENDSTQAFASLPVYQAGGSTEASDVAAGMALSASFNGASGSIIQALNHAHSAGVYTAGDGLDLTGQDFSVNVDDSSIEINTDSLRVKALGVTNAMLAGSIADSKLNQITTADKVAGSAVELATTSAIEDSTGLQLKAATAGDGLAMASQVLSVNVDDSSIETNADSLRVKALGITNAMLAGSIANAKLSNSTISGVSLGSDLNDLTVDDSTLALDSGTTFNGSAAKSITVKNGGITATQLAGSVSGNGLTGGAGVALAVGAGTGISVGADDVAIDLTADLTFSGVHKYGEDKLRIAGTRASDGAAHYFRMKVDGSILVLTEGDAI